MLITAAVLDDVPEELMGMLDNVVFLVEDEPPADDPELLGVYDGIPLTERDSGWSSPALISRRSLLTLCLAWL